MLTGWNDERGYGFIAPSDGSRRVFAHISEFRAGSPRPDDGDELSFLVGTGPDGRVQALDIETVHSARRARQEAEASRRAERRRAPIDWPPIAVVGAFAVLFVLMTVYWPVPLWVIILYPAMSVATYALYLADKRAALERGWRTRETTLQIAALVGGWPGAVLAQQLLRHKNRKTAFQAVFWCLVALNIAILVLLVWYQGPVADLVMRIGEWLAGSR